MARQSRSDIGWRVSVSRVNRPACATGLRRAHLKTTKHPASVERDSAKPMQPETLSLKASSLVNAFATQAVADFIIEAAKM